MDLTFRNIARSELSETNAKLSALSEGSTALVDRVKQTDIRSPVNGTVKQLRVNTVGGVVQPGKDLIEIVPSNDALLLEARVQPRDIAFLRPGQKALVKFTAYDFSTYGGLEATLEPSVRIPLSTKREMHFSWYGCGRPRRTWGPPSYPSFPAWLPRSIF